MADSTPSGLAEAVITIKNKALAVMWGVSEPRASLLTRPAHLPGIKDGGIWLQRALEIRPIVVDEAEFERLLAADATSLDGNPVEIARAQGLWTWNYDPSPRSIKAPAAVAAQREERVSAETAEKGAELREKARVEAAEAVRNKQDGAIEQLQPLARQVAGDLLAEARLEKIRAGIERDRIKARKELGELIERAEVQQAIMHAGSVVRMALESLPSDLADLMPREMRAEVRLLAEQTVERSLHAIAKALAMESEDDE
jgi:hypothetical protein